jgi:RHS repeat-associated protein
LTSEAHAGPIRFRDDQGSWRDVDLTLAKQADGSVAPKGHPGNLRLNGSTQTATLEAPSTTENDIVSIDEGKSGAGVSLAWMGKLGEPTLSGGRATYVDVQPGVDLTVDVLRNGFEQSMVVKSAAALAGLSGGGAEVSWSLPVKTRGLTARSEDDGSVSFVDAKDVVVSRFAAPKAWDAGVDPRSGEHTSTAPVRLTVAHRGEGAAVITMTPDQKWLRDPARAFPITVDPTYASTYVWTSFDTYVSSMFPTAEYSTSTELRVGTYNGGADAYRSFLTFPIATIKGKDIVSAALSLYETWSWSCTARPFYVYSAYGASTTTNWSNQPAAFTNYGSTTTTKGYSSSCPGGRMSVPITGLVHAWSGSTSSAGAIRLHASETDNYGWKKFASLESGADPYVTFTYNRAPNTPGTPTHTPGTSSSTLTTLGWTSTTTPTLKATVSDPDGGTVRALFSVYLNGGGTPVVDKGYGSVVASGGASTYVVPAGKLVNGSKYVVRAYGYDESLTSAAWSVGYDYFIVDTTAPNPPTVSSTTWTAGSWAPATSGTISWSDTSPDVASYSWKLDTGAWSAFGAATSQALSGLAANREHTFSVKGNDTTGHTSAATDFTFGVGVQCAAAGSRAASQPLTHQLNDSAAMSLNPTNGNLNLSGSLLRLRGVGQDLNIGWRYNALVDARPTLNTGRAEMALTPWSDGSFSYAAPDGGCYTFTKTGSTWSTPAGLNATMTSPVAGTVKLRFNPSGIVNTYVLTGGVYQLNTSADKNITNPNLISYTYTAGKLTSITDTQARTVTFAYTDAGNPTQPSTVTDTSLSRTINLVYGGPAGALSQITDATGAATTFGYDGTGLISLTNNDNQTSFDYDSSQRLVNWTFGAGTPEASNWAASYGTATTTTITDPNSNAAVYTIAGTRTTKITDPLTHGATSVWDGHDNLTSRTDALSNLTSNTYGNATNPNNLLADIISPAGTTGGTGTSRSLTFPTTATGALGDYQPTGTIDAQKNTSTIGYDTNTGQANTVTSHSAAGVAIGGVKTSTIQGDGAGTNCGAKTGEVCTTKNGNNNTTTYGYDSAGNPTSITPPAPLGGRVFTYDVGGRVLTAADGRGNTARYTYDANDRITAVSYAPTGCPAATCVAYTYDDAGNQTSRTSPTGVTAIGYDGLNRPTTKTQAAVLVSTATYDPASNLTSYTDTNGTTSYGYDTANRLVSLAEPGGSCPAYPTIPATPNATACTVFTLDNVNRRTAAKYPTGQITTTAYDNAGRVTSIIAKTSAAATLSSRTYTYQSAAVGGADQALRATMTDQTGTTTYGYDGLNRLTSAAKAGITSGWAYDDDGNRTTATKTGTPTTYSAYNGADQLCWTSTTSGSTCASPPTGATTYTYDTTGNQTTDQAAGPTLANSFNVFNQLTDTLIGGTTTFTSTYADTTNTERLTAGATSFLNGTLGITSQTTAGTTISYIRDPYGNLIAMRTAGQSYYYTSDAQGSVIALTDNAQALAASYTYDHWGNTTSTGTLATTNPWTYATGYTDPTTGYLKLGARYYNPTTARFTQPDPSGQEPNTYNYATCNPTNNVDPTGRSACSNAIGGLVTGALGFFGGTAMLVATPLTGGLSTIGAVGLYEVSAGGFVYGLAGVSDSC